MSTKRRDPQTLTQDMLAGDRIALARLITLVENRSIDTPEIMSSVYSACGKAHTIGITGPPGAGKSTITSCLIGHLRDAGRSVGVVAIDPSSPFSGGSVLGDRIRMQKHFLDPEVFIRSVSTRGSHGGLARCGRDVVRLFDAYGKSAVVIETVGVGQTELDVMEVADTVVVVLVPESGDTVQVMKAGLLEIADIFVVNKADRDGAVRMRTELEMMLSLKAAEQDTDSWKVPVLLSKASQGEGTLEILDACRAHRDFVQSHGRSERQAQALREEALGICEEEIMRRLRANADGSSLTGVLDRVGSGALDPYQGALEILNDSERLGAALGSPNRRNGSG
jgi:LAO/AO transport system kinase